MKRMILHADANCFYASVECAVNPALRAHPVAVCGDPRERHGIVLTKNELAKACGIKTGEAVWQAKQKCPNLVVVPPHYSLYTEYSRRMRAIYESYTDCVEAFGLDENWLELTEPSMTMDEAVRVAHEIRERVKRELGITVSVGVSFNKVFAKLGSDYKKPDAVTVITEENFQEIVWPLPVSDLIYVGPHTAKKLVSIGILTIGDLAAADLSMLQKRLGINGVMLKAFAMGLDNSRVMRSDERESIKSVGNSATPPGDIKTVQQAKCMIYLLSESVGARLRESGLRAERVSIGVRNTGLETAGCQKMLSAPSHLSGEIARAAFGLFLERYEDWLPLRSMGVSCSALSPVDAPVQIDLFGESLERLKSEKLESAIDGLRARFGHQVIRRGIVMFDHTFSEINPKEEQLIHPVAFLNDGKVDYLPPKRREPKALF